MFEDEFPFPKVGYVNSLEGIFLLPMFFSTHHIFDLQKLCAELCFGNSIEPCESWCLELINTGFFQQMFLHRGQSH